MFHLMEIPMCHQWAVLLCSDRIWFLHAGSIPGPLQRLPRTDQCLFLDSYCEMQRKHSQSQWLFIIPTNHRSGCINNISCHILKKIISNKDICNLNMLCKIKIFVKIGWLTESSHKMFTMFICFWKFIILCYMFIVLNFFLDPSLFLVYTGFLSSCKKKFFSVHVHEEQMRVFCFKIQDTGTRIISIFIPFSTIKQHVDPINAMLSGK